MCSSYLSDISSENFTAARKPRRRAEEGKGGQPVKVSPLFLRKDIVTAIKIRGRRMILRKMEHIMVDSVHEVFETLVYILPEEMPLRETEERRLSGELIASIHITGDISGIISLVCPMKVAELFTKNMLGTGDEPVGEMEITDCAGEIVNMVAGNIKTRCLDAGMTFSLSIPSVACGHDVFLSFHEDLQCICVPFLVEGEEIRFSFLHQEHAVFA
jgi:CheY-specific phosphatase CheX